MFPCLSVDLSGEQVLWGGRARPDSCPKPLRLMDFIEIEQGLTPHSYIYTE